MDSVQFKNIGTNSASGLSQTNTIPQNNRRINSAVTNPSAIRTSEYKPSAYTTTVTVRTSLTTKDANTLLPH